MPDHIAGIRLNQRVAAVRTHRAVQAGRLAVELAANADHARSVVGRYAIAGTIVDQASMGADGILQEMGAATPHVLALR